MAGLDNLSMVSNDLVHIEDEQHFKWLGRSDNVINSGGIKIHPEDLERQLALSIGQPFFVHKDQDETYGELVTLCLEGHVKDLESILNGISTISDPKQRPKRIYSLSRFMRTSNGKLQRKETFAQKKRRLV